MKKPYSNFDLPRQHIYSDHYVPSRARDTEEIARRRALPTGTILAEYQRDGLQMATNILAHVEEPEDVAFAVDTLAASGLNSAWYSYARHASVMRRRLSLPELANDEVGDGWRQTRNGLLTKAQRGLAFTAELAGQLAASRSEGREVDRQSIALGRQLGNVSLELACVRLGNAPESLSAFDVQSLAREQALEALEYSRVVASQTGTHPSLAQLADVDSPLSVYWRREATNGAYEAYERAAAEAA